MVAYLGGILGLFFGCTVLTFAEYIMFGVDLIIISVKHGFSSAGKQNKTMPRKPMSSVTPLKPTIPYPYPNYPQNNFHRNLPGQI